MATAKDKLSATFHKLYKPLWDKINADGHHTDPIDTSVERHATKGTHADHAVIGKFSDAFKAAYTDGAKAYHPTDTDSAHGRGAKAESCFRAETRADAPGHQSEHKEAHASAFDPTTGKMAGLAHQLERDAASHAKTADTSPLLLQLGGDSNAVGIDTLATGDVFSRVTDYGKISVAYGQATFSARAEVSGDDIAYASATSFADVSGADFIFTGTQTRSSALDSTDGATATERSQTFVLAIDFETWDFSTGPIVVDQSTDSDFSAWVPFLQDLIDGNIATLDVDAVAEGTNTYVDVAASLLTVEDQYSGVSTIVTSGVA